MSGTADNNSAIDNNRGLWHQQRPTHLLLGLPIGMYDDRSCRYSAEMASRPARRFALRLSGSLCAHQPHSPGEGDRATTTRSDVSVAGAVLEVHSRSDGERERVRWVHHGGRWSR
jgi:hypothetical protein